MGCPFLTCAPSRLSKSTCRRPLRTHLQIQNCRLDPVRVEINQALCKILFIPDLRFIRELLERELGVHAKDTAPRAEHNSDGPDTDENVEETVGRRIVLNAVHTRISGGVSRRLLRLWRVCHAGHTQALERLLLALNHARAAASLEVAARIVGTLTTPAGITGGRK